MSHKLTFVVLLMLGGIASAPSSAETAPSLPQPSPEIKRLVDLFSGTWSITLEMPPSAGAPKGADGGKGEEVWRPGPGALSLIEDYHSKGVEGEISGIGVAWWDGTAQKYQITWCDNGAPNGCTVIKYGAKWEGNQLVAMDEWQQNGKTTSMKEVFSDFTPTSFRQTIYLGAPGGELKKFLTIQATKAQ